jgi:inner membrane protein
MSVLTDLLSGFGHWNWFIAGLALMALETLIPGVHFLWFGLAAVIVGLLLTLFVALGAGEAITLPWQLVLFAVISVITVFGVRRFANAQGVESAEKDLNQRSAQYIGRIVVVEDDITGGRGRVRVGDTL